MILTHLNYLAVLVAGIVYFAIGGMWFSPMLFSNTWMKGHNISMPTDEATKTAMKKQMPKYMLFNLLVCFLGAMAIGYLETAACSFTWMAGAKIGLVAGFFVVISTGISHMYTKKSLTTFLIDAGYHVIGLIAVGIIMAVWH